MTINTNTNTSTSAASSNGFSGLASGVDTESMVEALLATTQNKIDKQNALKQQTEWKQEIYRDIIAQINSFQSKFFGSSATNNLLSSSFFNAMSASSSSSAFRATATTSAASGSYSLEVRRLATSTTLTSGSPVSGKLAGTLNTAALEEMAQKYVDGEYTVKFQVDGTDIDVDLKDVFVENGALKRYSSNAERDAAIQQKLEEAFADTGVTVEVKNGQLNLTGGEETSIKVVEGSDLGLKRLGLTASNLSSSKLTGKVDDEPNLSFTVKLDNLQKNIEIDLRDVVDDTGAVDLDKYEQALQAELDKKHGEGQISVVRNGDTFELKVSAGRKVVIEGDKDALNVLGVKNGQSNRIGLGGTLKDLYFANGLEGSSFSFTINGEEFTFAEGSTISEVMDAINKSDAGVRVVYRSEDDVFTMETTDTGAGRKIEISDTEGNLMKAMFGDNAVLKEGQNALVKIDGTLTERSSNSFSANGVNYDLKGTTGSYASANLVLYNKYNDPIVLGAGQYVEDGVLYDADGTKLEDGITYVGANGMTYTATGISADENGSLRQFVGTEETIEVTRNTDQIVDGLKQFVNEYNSLVKTLNDYLDEDANYRDYAPLTDAQRKEMSEKEIELWEEKAKQGLVRRDSTIETFLQQMRTVLYEKPEGATYALYDLGIETGTYDTKGQLVMSADSEARLRQVLESDPSAVEKLFTSKEDGLAVKLNKIIDQTAKISSGSPGALVELAGVAGKASEHSNTLSARLAEIEKKITALKATYEKEKTRYWNQFNAMEKMISNMNTQSSWLSQQFV